MRPIVTRVTATAPSAAAAAGGPELVSPPGDVNYGDDEDALEGDDGGGDDNEGGHFSPFLPADADDDRGDVAFGDPGIPDLPGALGPRRRRASSRTLEISCVRLPRPAVRLGGALRKLPSDFTLGWATKFTRKTTKITSRGPQFTFDATKSIVKDKAHLVSMGGRRRIVQLYALSEASPSSLGRGVCDSTRLLGGVVPQWHRGFPDPLGVDVKGHRPLIVQVELRGSFSASVALTASA